MSKTIMVTVIAFTLVAGAALAGQMQDEYYLATSDHYGVSIDVVADLIDAGIQDEDLPVVCFLAERTGQKPQQIAEYRSGGYSWQDVIDELPISSEVLYVMIAAKFQSKVFSPILNKFSSSPQSTWKNISFTDAEIVNLVNLRFISSYHDYNIFEVIAMRDYGKNYIRINQQIRTAKEKVVEDMAAKAAEEGQVEELKLNN